MNVTYIKYALEVERTGSITKAAENLYMGQPNLSKAIHELENSLGIRLFRRSPSGVAPTEQGRAFLADARGVMEKLGELERAYSTDGVPPSFRVAVPDSLCYGEAFAEYASGLPDGVPPELVYCVSSTSDAFEGLLSDEYDLAAVRLVRETESHYLRQMELRSLKSEPIWEFDFVALAAASGNLAASGGTTDIAALERLVEITSPSAGRRPLPGNRVYASDMATRLALLRAMPDAYALSSPVPAETLELERLVSIPVKDAPHGRDVLLITPGRETSAHGALFIESVKAVCQRVQTGQNK